MEKLLFYGAAAAGIYLLLRRPDGSIALPLDNLPLPLAGGGAPPDLSGLPPEVAAKRITAAGITGQSGGTFIDTSGKLRTQQSGGSFVILGMGATDAQKAANQASYEARDRELVAQKSQASGSLVGKISKGIAGAASFVTKVQYEQAKLGAALKGFGVKGAA